MNETAPLTPAAIATATPVDPPASESEKSASRLRPLVELWPFVRRYPGRIAAAGVSLTAAAIATLVIPLAVRRMIDFGFKAEAASMIDSYFVVLIAVAAVLALASALRYYLVTTLGELVVADVRSRVFAHITSLSPAFFDKTQSGEVISRLTADTTQIKSAVGVSVSIALRNLVLFAGAAGAMVWTSPRLSLFVLGAIPVIVLPLVAFGRSVRRRSRDAQDTLADASAYATELIGGVRTLQAFTYEKVASTRFSAAVERAFEAARQSTLSRALLTAIAIFLVFASIVLVLWIGAQDVMAGRISAGRLSQFVLYAVFAAGALSELSQVWTELSQASGAAERLLELLRIQPAIAKPANPIALPVPARGEVSFDNVTFAYPTRADVDVLDGLSFRLAPGERVALVGPSGAGKSTVFHLLLRFYDPRGGRVTFDAVPIERADPQELRERIALVPQDAVVFAGTIAENIGFGRPNATEAEISRAADLAQVTEFAKRLPQGLGTPIGERGVTLSGGQRQRVAIARAILRDAPLLLLDEATSALDAQSETQVQAALNELMVGRSTIVIAHRLATVLSCDRILVVDHGRVVEEGTHSSLIAAGGLYARLAKLQFDH
ncbi:multidrug resistance ABC transporter ATP-binding and permease protein [Variibacter gotjawalensis]|uniref:Multidrug resistance ABC transporter ATP-binding and permease protein n=2 Tax=Variibacter gotjawalensis TaxID=1333996 RepID=A0A0S3PVW1_9BRAD|nr:ABC transporter transmembrane domain-containing protein [Variibacter gotjawalensis]NIK45858.1 ATP-binding cassette subfamily B protein [Variibacter gotjawalensis]RZS47781.1 ATP-binding cassette subfamily B protein [Variibacter gotjawalensis]BAT60035.1 multidrug resistance ABC transporter ATP-binding and permease protein [Variibacter gotjawalensis]